MKISIVGYGHVGQAMHKLFKEAIIYDIHKSKYNDIEKIKNSDVVFVCVPTPMKKNGSCDTSFVEDVISKIDSKLFIIRSTVWIGFTDYASEKYKKNIVFQPEYYGETTNHPFSNLENQNWISFGGEQKNIDKAIEVYQEVKNSNVKIIQSSAKEIELAKYMENAFLALKVTFVNEMYDLAEKMNINYNLAREAWISDPRIGSSHTFVYKNNRGFGGSCLPKDIASLIYQADENGEDLDLIKAVVLKNKKYQK
ncbi:UDP-glucose/GDP-mannose dehydrogenase family protein [[Mycoplasma] mobile]|uniref:UDP-glucose dehydrogenase n=1 Tax=Mycoplasma mobile (strain ATCC 43663 / 163K / NCTC 11711) TaxID=267748 RepID=Q6KH44_MYCM1|nr:UDP-glucose/GDP-mannose dehydrogenase family protein [[Mycoplasma] mobile]AAT28087.1 UDP-glucose dehydrogenase [Mycoplasma mobile 163K]